MITGMQIRMARSALKWRVDDLSEKSGVSWARLQQLERNDGPVSAREDIIEKVKSTLEHHGAVFLAETDEYSPGVALRVERPIS